MSPIELGNRFWDPEGADRSRQASSPFLTGFGHVPGRQSGRKAILPHERLIDDEHIVSDLDYNLRTMPEKYQNLFYGSCASIDQTEQQRLVWPWDRRRMEHQARETRIEFGHTVVAIFDAGEAHRKWQAAESDLKYRPLIRPAFVGLGATVFVLSGGAGVAALPSVGFHGVVSESAKAVALKDVTSMTFPAAGVAGLGGGYAGTIMDAPERTKLAQKALVAKDAFDRRRSEAIRAIERLDVQAARYARRRRF